MPYGEKGRQVPRILMVDDEWPLLNAFMVYFRKFELWIDACTSVEQACGMIDTHRYRCVITDLRLTATGSEEGLDIVRYAASRCSEADIVLMTAYGSGSVRERARQAGAGYYLEKPVSPEELEMLFKKIGLIR